MLTVYIIILYASASDIAVLEREWCLNYLIVHRSKIKEDLLSGTTLVVDRYAYSGVAFTASKPVSSITLKSYYK